MNNSGIYVGPVSKRARREWSELSAGKPEINNPLYVILDSTYATNTPASGNYQYSEGVLSLRNSIEGFNRCAIVSFKMNNVASFPSFHLTHMGIHFDEMPGNTDNCNVNNNSSIIGNPRTTPTFIVPIDQPADTNGNIHFNEAQTNQFSIPISGLKFQRLTYKLCDESFFELAMTGTAPTNWLWTAELRFYNEFIDGSCGC